MNIFNADKIMNRLDRMLENAISGEPIEGEFDETKMSALETKLARYLSMTGSGKRQLAEEKAHINELVSDISHQTKTPIANILLYAQLLAEADLPDNGRLCVQSLTEQTEKLNFLIAALAKASRLEVDMIALTPKLQPIQPMLDAVLQQTVAMAQDKEIVTTLAPSEISAAFDQKWTTEAVYNIWDNAVKYTPRGGAITVTATAYQLFCRIDITDTGIGVAEDEMSRIFTRFYRSPSASEVEGVGIGLYLAREIVRGEGGYIKVESGTGKGSTFSVFLPMET